MRIDFHTHCFPDHLAPRAMGILAKNCSADASLHPHTDGTAKDTKALLSRIGIDRAVICNIATNKTQETNVNSFAISMAHDDFFLPLGSLHPDSEQQERELDRLAAAGICGVKLHPDYVHVPLSDKRFDRIFSLLEERGFFAIVHAGLDPISPDFIHATPEMFKEVIKRHPHLSLIAAHMGGFRRGEEVLKHLVGTNIYLDTSLSAKRPEEKDLLCKILHEHPADRLLFATDTPWSNPAKEIAFVEEAGLTDARKDAIFYKNAQRLLKLQ
ncbi:MAG: amidohydrolase family protein [Clostridia bacterium]|nr:amidohydrolase family protein [Clostridia bacterium]